MHREKDNLKNGGEVKRFKKFALILSLNLTLFYLYTSSTWQSIITKCVDDKVGGGTLKLWYESIVCNDANFYKAL